MKEITRRRSLIFVMLLGLTGPLSVLGAQPPPGAGPCQLTQLASLDLQIVNGRVLVPVTIQGEAASMYLNLGSSFSALSKQAVTRFALRTTDYEFEKGPGFMSGKTPVQQSAWPTSLNLGGVHYQDEEFPVDPLSEDSGYKSGQVSGAIGINRLWRMDLELDLAKKKMNLYSPDHCPAQGVQWTSHYQVIPLRRDGIGGFFFPVELDGRKIEATFGPTNSLTTLSTDVTRRLYGFDKNSPDIQSVRDASGKVTAHTRAMALTVNGLTLMDETVMLTDPSSDRCRLAIKSEGAVGYTDCTYRYPLHLGNSLLEKLHVYIATKENILYYTVNESVAAAQRSEGQ